MAINDDFPGGEWFWPWGVGNPFGPGRWGILMALTWGILLAPGGEYLWP